ncbi:MAG: 50S ribosomal protein L1 [Candidatus Omnitrophica bacterium]|nr:50S ribosomal protein L1 [Candidatus Omnitrophota bacterium]
MARKISKRYKARLSEVQREKLYTLDEAVQSLKKIKNAKYDETVALNIQLGIKPDQSDQMVRGTVSLPNGSGKDIRVICFCKGEEAKAAQSAGANLVGGEELVQKVQEGWFEFDAVVAHPDMMREVSKLGRVLGPRGLMPTPKTGTVTPDVGRAVRELKAGRVEFKNDKTAGLHVICGKLSFSESALKENIQAAIKAIRDAKPASSRGDYLRKISVAPTQGPGIALSVAAL